MKVEIDKNRMKDTMGRYLTQGMFLEHQYNTDVALFTLEGEHKEYKGGIYYSLKKLYLQEEDPIEYTFANRWLVDWPHWKKMQMNKWINQHILEWREELEYLLASKGIQYVLDAAEGGNFQAAKFAAERAWSKKRGRPSNEERMKTERIEERLRSDFDEDVERVSKALQ